jgi:protein involved in ribonucleotide reduction
LKINLKRGFKTLSYKSNEIKPNEQKYSTQLRKEHMNIRPTIFVLIFCFFSKDNACSQVIKINYHLGYDSSTEINGKVVKGGCLSNDQMEYTPKKGGKYIESGELKITKTLNPYENGSFSEKIEIDSSIIFRINRKIPSKKFNQLVTYLKIVESTYVYKTESPELNQKKALTKWDKHTFELSQSEIRKIKKIAKKENGDLSTDSLIQIIRTYVKGENQGFLVSSVVEFLNITFEYEKRQYSIIQNNLGGVNVSWEIAIDDKLYFVISPELNKMISPFLAKKMRAKKKINQFLRIEELKKAFRGINTGKNNQLNNRYI